uniref:Uncharacterized protein n=1 Tax=Rhizophora mucronata TaxID=61149 RepID=A0A2P2J3I6_RHIMU
MTFTHNTCSASWLVNNGFALTKFFNFNDLSSDGLFCHVYSEFLIFEFF